MTLCNDNYSLFMFQLSWGFRGFPRRLLGVLGNVSGKQIRAWSSRADVLINTHHSGTQDICRHASSPLPTTLVVADYDRKEKCEIFCTPPPGGLREAHYAAPPVTVAYEAPSMAQPYIRACTPPPGGLKEAHYAAPPIAFAYEAPSMAVPMASAPPPAFNVESAWAASAPPPLAASSGRSPRRVPNLGMKPRPGICSFTVLVFWGKNAMVHASTMAYHRYFPSTTRI